MCCLSADQMQEILYVLQPVNHLSSNIVVAPSTKMDLSSFDDCNTRDSEVKIDDIDDDVSVVGSPYRQPITQKAIGNKRISRLAACSVKSVNNKNDGEIRKWLLNAVRRIREQKQRSNVTRIMNQLRLLCPGRFNSPELVAKHLEEAVLDGELIRVGPPGDDCSYRDPGRVVKLKTHSLEICEGGDLMKIVIRAVRDLADPLGATLPDIHRYIRSSYAVNISDNVDLQNAVIGGCRNAVAANKLVRICGEVDRYQLQISASKLAVMSGASSSSTSAACELVDRAFNSEVCIFSYILSLKIGAYLWLL